ncbi:hypothetical protein BP422_00745 [Brevibacillus formosus]|uniref:Uncharacterized protein n=1 Tax=Brevibacillus formosus TaxID=54913 RepID=A0A220MBB7_9BACL|nr:hypothetical protein [Brevibacillus formosus]ASJ52193.1 hypothetical protein BP422_00745 [Brevibacillus formosus]
MSALFGLLGFLAMFVGIILLIVNAVRKKQLKVPLIVLISGFVSFIIGVAIASPTTSTSSNDSTQSSSSVATTSTPDPVKPTEDDAKKKTEEEAKAKAASEEQAMADAEAKKKADEEAKKRAEEEVKYKNINYAAVAIPAIAEGVVIKDETIQFVVANYKLFPAGPEADVKAALAKVDNKIKYGLMEKNITPYINKMVASTGRVLNVEEAPSEGVGTGTVSLVHMIDDSYNSYRMFIMKSTGDIIKGDNVRIVGVPISTESFSNISGGTTKSIFLLGSHINKIQ